MFRSLLAASFVVFTSLAAAQAPGAASGVPPGATDWGGGFYTGVDTATQMSSNSATGAGSTVDAPTADIAGRCAALAGYATLYSQIDPIRQRFAQIPDAPTLVQSAVIVPAERNLPEVCDVMGLVAPNIHFELRLPTRTWNGKFMHYGCGGPCGVIYRPQLEEPLARHYAVVASDMGHQTLSNAYKYADIAAQIDFTYRATHVVTLASKEIVDQFYARPARKAYFMGCSTGGVQGVIEAQRFPDDFQAMLVAAPAYGIGPSFLEWSARANVGADGRNIMTPEKLPMVRKAVLAACDAQDGLKDGLLMDPRQCKWDPAAIQCKAGASDTTQCLTAPEVGVIRKIYSGPVNSKGESLSLGDAGMMRGSEYLWSPSFIPPEGQRAFRLVDQASSFGDGFYPPVAANAMKPYDYDTDPQRGDILSWLRYGMNPDLRFYRNHGGKILMYHGWDDNEVAAGSSVDYYQTTTRTMGGEAETRKFFRLFMVPGMGHCRRGPGGDAGDFLTALENWDEKGQAPEEIVMHHLVKEQNYLGLPRPIYPLPAGSYDRTRPVYPFPDVARYAGKGDPAQASSWVKGPRAPGE